MPTYDYTCEACGHAFEKFQSITAAPVRKCPACGKNRVKRLIGTGAGLIFKGGGFYQTDYRSDTYKADAKKDAGGSASTSGGEAKADAGGKPAETPAATPKPAEPTAAKPRKSGGDGDAPKKKSA